MNAKRPPDAATTYSRIVVHFNTLKVKMQPLELVSEGDQLTYKSKDSCITFEWTRFDKDKPAFVRRRVTIPTYNIAYAEEFIEYQQDEEVKEDAI